MWEMGYAYLYLHANNDSKISERAGCNAASQRLTGDAHTALLASGRLRYLLLETLIAIYTGTYTNITMLIMTSILLIK